MSGDDNILAPPPDSSSSSPECMCRKPASGASPWASISVARCAAKKMTCRKEGPNKGRPFWTCASRSCSFFESADGKPWIRGRTVCNEFRPFKKFRLADSSVKEVYSTIPTLKCMPLDYRGVEFVERILAKEEDASGDDVVGEKKKTKTADAITALRIYPCLKIVRGLINGFTVKKKLPPIPGEIKSKSSGYKFVVAGMHNTGAAEGTRSNWELTYIDPRDEECSRLVCEFISGLATDPAKTIGDMGKKMGSCCVCGHNLTDPASIADGYGSVCARIFKK